VVGGREIGSALFNSGGTLGLDVVPSDVRSVLILGGRRGPDVPGRSHNVCLLSTSLVVEAVCGLSRGGLGRGKGDPADSGVDDRGNFGIVRGSAGMGCGAFWGELDGIGRAGGEDCSGKNARALGFNGILGDERVVPKRGGWSWGGSRTVFGDESANEGSGFVIGGVG